MKFNQTVAVVGAGKWGQNLVKTFSDLGALAAIVELEEERGLTLASGYQVPFYRRIESLLATDIQAVAIATPVFSHFDMAKKALLAKKDVFVEKPMTTTLEEADELISLAKKNNCILMVGQLLLYQPAIQFIKDFLAANRLGNIFSFTQVRRSLGTIRKEENVLYSLGVHDLAVLHYLIPDKIKHITTHCQEVISKDIADSMSIHFHYSSGIQAHIHLSWLWPIKDRQLMILGQKGALHFDEIKQEVIYYQHFGNQDRTITAGGYDKIFSDSTAPLKLELEHFLECIKNRSNPRSCGELGREVVALMSKIMEADEVKDD